MATFPEEEVPLLLVRPSTRPSAGEIEDVPVRRRRGSREDHDEVSDLERRLLRRKTGDRMGASAAGALAGALAGAAALGTVQYLDPGLTSRLFAACARMAEAAPPVNVAVAYAVLAVAGAFVGVLFAQITKRLRRWLPLLFWALVSFPAVTLLVLALLRTYVPTAPFLSALGILPASGVFALVWSLSVPLRVRATYRRRADDLVP